MSDAKRTISRTSPRPWWVGDQAIEEHKLAIQAGDRSDPRVKRTLTILRSLLVNAGIIGLAAYGLALGGDVTWITVFGLAVLGAYNGIEATELMAFLQAYQEVQEMSNSDE